MRLALRVTAFLVVEIAFLSGCADQSTAPSSERFSTQGLLTLAGQNELITSATVRLFAQPQDNLIAQAQAAYPALNFAQLSPLLFNPLTQNPLKTSHPDSGGYFQFHDLPAGGYVVDAVLEGYGLAEPLWITLPGAEDMGTLNLTEEQPLSGNLDQSTWQSGQVYRVTGDIFILPEAVLTVEPGVLILVDGDYTLTVSGGIQAAASPEHPVRFRLSDAYFQPGYRWEGIKLDHSQNPCILSGVQIQGALTAVQVMGAGLQMTDCLLEAPGAYGVYFSAEAEGSVSHSIVRDGDEGLAADNSHPEFSRNLILRMAGTGISVKSNSQALIQQNILLECQTGIWSDWNTAPLIQYNFISGGARALDAQNGFAATVQYNEFSAQSEECIYLHYANCYPLIENNNFLAAPQVILYVTGVGGSQADTIYAPDNYWDGDGQADIPLRIVDGHDIGSPSNPIGPVMYEPFRLTPVEGAGP